MALIRALRELELFHFLQRSTECRRCLLILACDSAFSRWSAARVEIQRAPGESERGAEGGQLRRSLNLRLVNFSSLEVEISAISTPMSFCSPSRCWSKTFITMTYMYVYLPKDSGLQSNPCFKDQVLIDLRRSAMILDVSTPYSVHNRHSCYPRASSCGCMQMISHSK